MIKKFLPLFIDFFFVLLVLIIAGFVLDFKFGQAFLAGDFRLHLNSEYGSEYFVHIFSHRFSANTFIFVPFLPLYSFLQHLPYQLTLVLIFFGIPASLYISTKLILLNIYHGKKTIGANIFLSSLAFFFAINPALFDRYVHFTILYGAIFFLPYLLFLYRYIRGKKIISKYFFFTPVFLYLGIVTPQIFVVYVLASILVVLFSVFLATDRSNLLMVIKKTLIIALLCIISIAHVLTAVFLGFGVTKSLHESATSDQILERLSEKSNIVSALSGTNQFNALIHFPTMISVGFFLFVFALVTVIKKRKPDQTDALILTGICCLLLIIVGYSSYSLIYGMLNKTFIHNIMWLVKDPSTYYLYFLALTVVLLGRNLKYISEKPRKIFVIAIVIAVLNIFFVLLVNKEEFNIYYRFHKIPDRYYDLRDFLKNDSSRNLWLPSDAYVTKDFTKEQTHFPSPSFWLTENKEITYLTKNYQDLLKLINEEIYEKKCVNTRFLNWLFGVQKINIIIDHSSINNKKLGDLTTEDFIREATSCLSNLPNVYLYRDIEGIRIYKSDFNLSKDVVEFRGSIEDLNSYLASSSANVLFKNSNSPEFRKLEGEFSLLNESYDTNWSSEKGLKILGKANFSSILYSGNDESFYYKGYQSFEIVVITQKILLISMIAFSIIYEKSKKAKKV